MEFTKRYLYFCKIVDSGSISAAAKDLGLAQPFLSAFIKDLEGKLNCSLFDRTTKPYHLTSEGEAFYRAAKAIINQEKILSHTINGLKKNNVVLNVGVGSTRVKNLIGDSIVEYLSKFSNVKLNIIEIINTDALEILENGSADIIIHFNDLSDKNIISEIICKEKLVLVRHKSLSGEDVYSLPRIVLPEGQLVRTISDEICHEGKIILECDKLDTALYYANKGIGTTIVPSYLLKDFENLKTQEIVDERCSRNIYVSYKKNNNTKVALINFINVLLNNFTHR